MHTSQFGSAGDITLLEASSVQGGALLQSFTVAKADAGVVFGCGRAVNSNFHGTKEFDSTWMCKMCKAKALKDGALGPKRKD